MIRKTSGLCKKKLHELKEPNIVFEHGRRTCRACKLKRQNDYRKANRPAPEDLYVERVIQSIKKYTPRRWE